MVPKPYTAVCPASLFNISRLVSCKNRQINRTHPAGDKKRERPAEPERSCHYSLSVEDRSESRPTGRNGLRTACDVSSMPRAEHKAPCRPSHSAPAKRIVGRPGRKNRPTESSSVPRIRRASVADRAGGQAGDDHPPRFHLFRRTNGQATGRTARKGSPDTRPRSREASTPPCR